MLSAKSTNLLSIDFLVKKMLFRILKVCFIFILDFSFSIQLAVVLSVVNMGQLKAQIIHEITIAMKIVYGLLPSIKVKRLNWNLKMLK